MVDAADSKAVSKKSFSSSKLIKDVKFGVASFIVMVLIIFHYAWIMRQLLLYPSMPRTTLLVYFFGFGVSVFGLGYYLLFSFYPTIYVQELKAEKMVTDSKKTE